MVAALQKKSKSKSLKQQNKVTKLSVDNSKKKNKGANE